MRLTVGPLPSAVYWRRRAVVLGAGMLFVIVLLYSCNGSGKTDAAPQETKSPSAPANLGPTGTVLTPETGAPADIEQPAPPVETTAAATEPAVAAPTAAGSCTDAEMSVTPVPSQTSFERGVTIELRFKIKNISDRTCSRDVGADPQELYIKLGAQKIWSSDTCGTARGSDVQSFPPNIEHEYRITWNGRQSTRCENGLANGPYPEPGEYQLFGRLGTKLSDPVKLTITG
jgi:hypothetical protein